MAPGGRPEEICIGIPSRLDFLGILNHTISELGDYLGLEEEVVDALAIAVIEAGTNAIQHGSPSTNGCQVEFKFEISADEVVVRVHDDGPGFDPTHVGTAKEGPDALLESRGRGIFLMRSFMDTVDFAFGPGSGTTVELRKKRPAKSRP